MPIAVAELYDASYLGQKHSGIGIENMEVCAPLEPK